MSIDITKQPPASTGTTASARGAWLGTAAARAQERAADAGAVLIRAGLALVFVWFGALKVAGISPVAPMLTQTFPFLDPNLLVRGLGVVEVVLGLGLIAWRRSVLPLVLLGGHLTGTFVTFVLAPARMFDGSLFAITTEGEFVVKNVILIGAILTLVGARRAATTRA